MESLLLPSVTLTMEKQHNFPLLTIVIPAYNESASLAQLLPAWARYCRERNWNLILVNDGSTDDTARILNAYAHCSGVTIVHHKVNRGYGGAIKTGVLRARTPYVVTIDADGQHVISDVEKVFRFALEQDADLVIGKREGPSSGLYRQAGKVIIRAFARLLMPLPITDLNSGFKLYRTDLVRRYIKLCPDSMAFSDVITLLFINQRHLVQEYPVQVLSRQTGKSTINILTAIDTLLEILHLAVLINPLRVFLPMSAFWCLIGIGWGLPFVLMGKGVSAGAMLAIVIGVLFFFLGLIVNQIAALRIQLLEQEQPRIPDKE